MLRKLLGWRSAEASGVAVVIEDASAGRRRHDQPAVSCSIDRLILVVGKGGVGRSTVAAAIAGQLAARGQADPAVRDQRQRSLR